MGTSRQLEWRQRPIMGPGGVVTRRPGRICGSLWRTVSRESVTTGPGGVVRRTASVFGNLRRTEEMGKRLPMLGSDVRATRRLQGRIGLCRRIEAGVSVIGSVAMTARTQGGDVRVHQRPEERLTQGLPQSWRLTWMRTWLYGGRCRRGRGIWHASLVG